MNKNSGFTLIEVLISVIVLAVGLLGMAALQGAGVKSSQVALNRSLATQLAYDIADRMRANQTLAATTPSYVISDLAQFQAINDANLTIGGANYTCKPCECAGNPCLPAQLAQKDLIQWKQALSVLPNSTATIVVNGGVYTVTISWKDSKEVDGKFTNFQMSFRI